MLYDIKGFLCTTQQKSWKFYYYNGQYYTDDNGFNKQLIMSNSVKKRINQCEPLTVKPYTILIGLSPWDKSSFFSIIKKDSYHFMIIEYDSSYYIKSIRIIKESAVYYP